ncbi:MAG: hypothetical protein ABSA33_02820 [Candidatus Micrarchaeaceae archaeon]|jgi:hypothetical protein
MTATTARKVATLVRITKKNLAKVKKKRGNSPFVVSAAKYYPALKRLAEK